MAMKHASLNGQEDSIKRFVMALAVEAEGSVLELDGKAVARLVPMAPRRNGHPATEDEWNDAKNVRRCALIDQEFDGGVTPEEMNELADLQEQMIRFRDKVAPMPSEDARRLHQELLMKTALSASQS